jgi:dipeptidyl-peptidase-3
MKLTKYLMLSAAASALLSACGVDAQKNKQSEDISTTSKNEKAWYTEEYQDKDKDGFRWKTERFSDIKIVKYKINGFEKLSLKQKQLVYFLSEAGYAGRDIIWDQNYRHNLTIRRALENIVSNFNGDKSSNEWTKFMVYTKRVWFANGIHHHYSMNKFEPAFSKDYFSSLLNITKTELTEELVEIIFNPEIDNKKVSLDASKDLLLASATNFYGPDVTQKDAEDFYAAKMDKKDATPISYGLNSKLVKTENGLEERVWKSDGMYGEAIDQVTMWLSKAVEVAENKAQKEALELLIEYYKTGDLKIWDAYNIAWVKATKGDIDYINSFIEVYNDPLGYRGSYETIIQMNDFEASERMAVLANNAQWFEDNSSIMNAHKKKEVKGVSYKVVEVAAEAGDASPATPIGVNLPNANWIRSTHGSKSVSLGSVINAYSKAGSSGMLDEFCHSEKEKEMEEMHGGIADKMHTALHEVIGHASGKLNPGVGTPKETLKNYASTLEEARADLVGLYYLMDTKLVDMGLISSLEVGKTAYDGYIRNGLLTQLTRLDIGDVIEEAHMRNRQLVAAWAMEKGANDKVIEKVTKDGKTFFIVNDYDKLRVIFGELLQLIQKIKSEGDYQAGKDLVENYGVQVDQAIHVEVLKRVEKLNIAPYSGFINPKLVPEMNDAGEITNIKVTYPDNFAMQMLDYAKNYSFLPNYN